ncbi:uncharacterized protein F4822DRAFT_386526 [Hypoxylon trugodes]|uniref:uncharacterized protein n=1 Tax=Hypoxylon trugodes TaxID=326681 RepID=UPI0021919012|nr:uncharacterized protein F4822DRAFT_386526 [Hypoxylon trugodes]KAI1393959.1 hypothetical protein F4822DRAFT_386526 [Hypoxylon trugodes]
MKFTTGPLFATLALTAYLPNILAVDGFAASRGSVAVFRREVANNGTAAANGTEAVDAGQNNENADENANEEEQNLEDQQNADEQNQDQNQDENQNNEDQNVEQGVDELENRYGINLDNNNLEASLLQNIGGAMLSLGICNFNLGSLGDIGVNNQIQLLLQLQQLAQLQQLGLVSSRSIEQLLQQELLLNNFNLNIFKRTINATVKQAARENKRNIAARKECKGK